MSNYNTQDLHNRINNIYQELGDIIKESENEWPNPERVKGRWYKINFGHALVNYQGGKQCFGLNNVGQWTEHYVSGRLWDKWRDATESEINDMLVKEAVKRGYKVGDKLTGFKSWIESGLSFTIPVKTKIEYDYYLVDSFSINNMCVYSQGQWATIITESPIMIGSYVVRIGKGSALINDYSYTAVQLQLLYDTACLHKVNVSIMGVQVAKETLGDIIGRLDHA